MRNSELRPQIDFAFKRVKRIGAGWGYIPLNELPEGTEISFSCKTALPPLELVEINGETEQYVTRVAEGQYTLIIFNWPTILFDRFRGSVLEIKPYSTCLAPGAPFSANYDRSRTTYRLETGVVQSAYIPGTKYRVDINDRPRKKKPVKRRPRSGHIPLRNRSWG